MGDEGRVGNEDRATRKPFVLPKGRGSTIVNVNLGNGPKCVQFIVDDIPNQGGATEGVIKRRVREEEPIFPRCRVIRENLVDKFH
jgi:hypothetical protein